MKLYRVLLLISLLFCGTLLTAAQDRGVYRVPREAREALIDLKATVSHGHPDSAYTAELTPEQVATLSARGFRVELLFASIAERDFHLRHLPGFDDFHTYDQIRSAFYSYAAAHPDLAQLEVLGTSVQGRELFALKISDNVQTDENEPELAFWGNIHGNEYAGGEMPYLYALYLLDNYGVNPTVTGYVNDNEIWCIPMINPDGRVNGQRDNANGVDLNRDFGYQWDGWGASWYPFSQVETRTVREFCLEHDICLSTTFHCSGDIVFYPWGYSPDNTPDLDVIFRVGQRYANAAQYAYGNSWEDYETHGELLDNLYGTSSGLCYTMEVSSSSSGLAQTYARNQAGMNMFCDLAGEGIQGTVTDAQSGDPLLAAVWISGSVIPSYTTPNGGDLHRLVLPGTYSVTVWANGYLPQVINNIRVTLGSPGQFQATLQPGGGEYAFAVTSVNQEDPNNAHNNVTFPAWALRAPDGLPNSLGANGFIVLDMGAGHEIVNGPGNDFTVTEAINNHDLNPESYRVYAGDAYNQNTLIGTAIGTASFDLASAGVASTRYLKIVDQSGASPNLPLAGMDLDAVTILNSAWTTGVQVADARIQANTQPESAQPKELTTSVSPNPFNPTTVISFELRVSSYVKLGVFDVAGQRVGTGLAPVQWYPSGPHQVTFDGSSLPSGIYLAKLTAGDYSAVQKLVLLK